MLKNLIQERLKKLEQYRREADPYPARVRRSTTIGDFLKQFSKTSKKKVFYITGRLTAIRDQGKISFAVIENGSGKIQLVFIKEETKNFSFLKSTFDIGDIIEAAGSVYLTKRGERSVLVKQARLIAKSLKPWPSAWFGLKNIEERYRKRYLDFIYHPETKEKIVFRSRLIAELRNIFAKEGFLEMETPILQPLAGGAAAEPFKAYFRALGEDVYLRIAPELYLKRLLVGGFEKIFEIGKDFRNEGIDREHYPEFTMLELYWAYQDYQGLMAAAERWLKALGRKLGKKGIVYEDKKINFFGKWQVVKYFDLVHKYTKAADVNTKEIDEIFKKQIRPKIIQPTFVVRLPKIISPLAKSCEDDPNFTERFQLIVAGTEVVNGFSELNDPIEQRRRMEEQERRHRAGDREASRLDEDFLEALEYGLPPAAGLGLGVDRLVALFTDSHSIRETISFPILRTKEQHA